MGPRRKPDDSICKGTYSYVPVQKVIYRTLLLEYEDYDVLASDRLVEEKYLLIYSRRYNSKMEDYAERMAKQNGWEIVEISLRATNAEKGQIMFLIRPEWRVFIIGKACRIGW